MHHPGTVRRSESHVGNCFRLLNTNLHCKKERKTKVRSGFDLREKECHFTAAPLQRLPGMAAANLLQQ